MTKKLTRLLLALALAAAAGSVRAQAPAIPKWKASDLAQYIDTASAPTVINFWATFCKPCIAEIPYFQELTDKYRQSGVRLLLVSLDLPEDFNKISVVARKWKIMSPIAFLDESNADLFCPKVDSSWSGALPGTLFLNRKAGYRKFVEDALSREKLGAQISAMLKKNE